MRKISISAVFITIIVFIAATIFIFTWKFFEWPPKFSNNIGDWSSSGSYFGGILGPLLAVANIAVLYHLTVLVERANSERQQTQAADNIAEKNKERVFLINQFNLELMRDSYKDIYSILKNFNPLQILEVLTHVSNIEQRKKRITELEKSLFDLELQLGYFTENNYHVFPFLEENHDRFPKQQLQDIESSIHELISFLRGEPDSSAKDECKRLLTQFFSSRDKLLTSFQIEIKQSIKDLHND